MTAAKICLLPGKPTHRPCPKRCESPRSHHGFRGTPLWLLLPLLAACPDEGDDDDATSAIPVTQTPTEAGRLDVSPTSVTFPDTEAGAQTVETIVLTNSGAGPITLAAVYFPNDADGAFAFAPGQNDPTGTVIQGEDSLTVSIAFAPPTSGTFDGTWRVASNDPDRPSIDVPLSGTGTTPTSPDDDQDGYTVADGDCDDDDPDVHPGATEICNDRDDDCNGEVDEQAADAFAVYPDNDQDGYGNEEAALTNCIVPDGYTTVGDDCNDEDPSTHPGADELCDQADNDCDGAVDEEATDAMTVYPDTDGDGYGATSGTLQACTPPEGYVAETGDCDDDNPGVNPDALEVCDGIDNNCDGQIDNTGETLLYVDADGDGHGDPDTGELGCGPSDGRVPLGDDCDDTNGATYPGADEYCDGIDNDCDGAVDENPVDGSSFYEDNDLDGHGAGDPITACEEIPGLVTTADDCDDTSATTYPGADEPCDGVDNDCDGETDEGGQTTLYADQDGDGWGDETQTIVSCNTEGYVGTAGDCNDLDPNVHPSAEEVCDHVDQDCDGAIDEGVTTTYYLDRDGDGYGDDETTTEACSPPTTVFLETGGDCDDLNAAVNPGATETCNAVDDDCDGLVDEDTEDAASYYVDADGDGYGDPAQGIRFCTQPDGYVLDGTDCDDSNPDIHPGQPEVCNEVDEDCNGVVDDNPTDATTWYPDVDQDGYGSIAGGVAACEQPPGYLPGTGDCNDSIATIHPDATEVCDGVDQDCDGLIDEDMTWAWYIDRDGDGYGDESTEFPACQPPSDFYVDLSGDCDDFDANVFPEANELCNGKDDDCDGTVDEPDALDAITWYRDADGDGHGDPDAAQVACQVPDGYVASDDDCDDTAPNVFTGATEWCNTIDDDCDGEVDEPDAADAQTWYLDVDQDGYGTSLSSVLACDQPDGHVLDATDCNDSDPNVNPGATEVCNGTDDDCDGITDGTDAVDGATWYQDADSDGFGNPTRTQVTCTQPVGYVDNGLDCDDLRADTYPDAPEIPDDAWDNDCDGKVDENGPLAALPVGLTGHATVYDPIRERVLVIGGRTRYALVDEVYVLDLSGGNTGVWETLEPEADPSAGTPLARHGHTAIYDTDADQVVLFGGRGYHDLLDDVWVLSFATSEEGTWSRLSPSDEGPRPRTDHAAAYDPVDAQMVIHGGKGYYGLFQDTWSLSLPPATPTWTLLHDGTGESPGPRYRHGLEFDSTHDRFLLFGGDGFYARNNDLWAFDLATGSWSQLSPTGPIPPPLADCAVTFDSETSELLVFGGISYYAISDMLLALDVSNSADGSWSVLYTPGPFTPTAGAGALVLYPDALYYLFFGQGYYGLRDRPMSGERK